MTTEPHTPRPLPLPRELIVPAIMFATIGFYLCDAWSLSTAALLLPVSLMVVVSAAVAWSLASDFLSREGGVATNNDDAGEAPLMSPMPWLLVLLPAAMILIQDYVGAFVALLGLVFGSLLLFRRKRPLVSLMVGLAVTLPTYALFKHFLYVRFPSGVLGIG